MGGVAVLIASDLAKDMAGEPLLRGVSFKLERRDRLTIAGRNGAGKTTLLRMLAGETSIDGGELVLAKGTRIALHDQRPPRERDLSAARLRAVGACKEPLELEAELARLEHAMADGDEQALNRYADVNARFEAAGGYGWRERARSTVHGLGFVDADLDRPLATFSGGQLTRASLARALAAEPDLLLLDEPTNHLDIESLEWLEQTLLEPRRGDRPRRPRPLVPGDRRAPPCSSSRPAARASSTARGTTGARSRPRASWRSARRSTSRRPRSRAWRRSSSASAPRRPRRARRSRASRSSTRSSASSATRATARAWSSSSRSPSARAA